MASTNSTASTTTISSIAVQSGNTRLVIALLQSGDVLELRIQELSPEMSDVGSSYEEALHLQQQHQQVLQKLQNKQSPVEELLSQADELIANQKPKAQVYSAMAHNLGLAWKNLNAQLEHRSMVLDTAVQYHAAAKKLSEELAKGEQEFSDSFLPDQVAACEARLQRLNEARKAILEASKRSLQPFQNLLQTLKEVASTGDSRPLQPAAALAAIAALESQHESLQDQRRKLGLLCEARKEALEKRLRALLLSRELDEVERQLELSPDDTALGDSPASSEILLHEHTTRIASANEKLRDRMLKLLKAAKQIQEPEVETRAFDLMARVTSRIERDDARKRNLKEAVEFFNEAQTALNKLDQLQIQVSQGPIHDLAAATMLLDACVEKPLFLGHGILARLSLGTSGVQDKVDELQTRHLHVRRMYEQRAADVVESSERAISLMTQCNNLYKWCIEVVQTFLEQNSELGVGAAPAHDFLQKHQRMLNELQAREPQMTALLAQDDPRAKELLQLWQHLRNLLEQRIRLAQRYFNCCKLSTQLIEDLKTISDASPERQATINENFLQFDHNANNFLHDAQRIQDAYLDFTKAVRHMQETLDQCHQLKNNPGSNTEQLIKDAQKTIESAAKIESELYPAIPRELNRAETIAQYLGRHLDTLMPLVRTIQSELEARIESTATLQRKENLVHQLRTTQDNFQRNVSQYQELVRAMITFFDYFAQLEKKLRDTHEDEALLAEAKRRAEILASLVDKTEPSEAAVLDRDKIHLLVDNRSALLAASVRKSQQDSQMSKFNEELQLINQQVRELTDSLKRDSSKCHLVEFQQRIQSLERRIEVLCTSSRLQTDTARMELEELTSRWRTFHKEAMAAPPPQPIERKETKEVCGPSFVVPLDDVEVQDGAKCSLVCVLAGHPPPTVQWYKDGVSIRGNSDYVTTSQQLEDGTSEQKLTIEETLADDSAKFSCKAINAAGLAETSCRLSVREQARENALEEVFIEALEEHTTHTVMTEPTFAQPLPATVQLQPGEELRLECSVQGQPEPRVSWSKDLLPVRDAAKPSQELGKARLVLAGAVETDSGTYTAVAKNKAGETACSCQVKVAEDVPPPEPPRVLKALEDLEVKPGPDPTTLECIIVGRPEPEVIWYHNGQLVKESERVRLLFRGDRCSLVLNGVSAQNAGTYRCSAVNRMGSCYTECVLRVPHSAPVFLEPLRDVNTDEGARVVLSAKVWAPEPPFVHWFKDGREVVVSNDCQVSHDPDGTVKLLIPTAVGGDSGHYEVEASNAGGRTRTGCRVNVRQVQKAVHTSTQMAVSRTSQQTVSRSGSEMRLARSLPPELVVQSGTKVCLSVAGVQPLGGQLSASWFRSGQPITDSPDFRLTKSMENVAGTSLAVFSLTISEAFPEDSGDLEVRVQGPNGVVVAHTKLVVLDEDDEGTDNVQVHDDSIHQAREVKVYETKLPRGGPEDSSGLAVSGDLQMRVTEVTQVNEMPPEVSEEKTTKVVDQAGAKDKVTEEVTRRVTKRVTEITKTQTKELSTCRASRAAGPPWRVEPIPVAQEPKFDILEPKYDGPPPGSRPIHAEPEESRPSLFEPLSVRTSFCLETGQFQSPRSIIRTRTSSPVWSPKKKAVVIAENPATGQRVSAPVFLQGPEDVCVAQGLPATMRALVTGCPAPRLRWFKDGQPVHGPDHVVNQPSGPAPWTAWLSIPEAFPEDSGVYVCTASNLVGNTSACCRLTVFGQ